MSERILVLSPSIDTRSAAGKVFGQLVSGMEDSNADVIVCGVYQSELKGQRKLDYALSLPRRESRWSKILYVLFGRDWLAHRWAKKMHVSLQSRGVLKEVKRVIVLGAQGHDEIMELGARLQGALRVPFHVHFVDAIPPPALYGEALVLRGAKARRIRWLLGDADTISAITEEMYQHQLSVLGRDSSGRDRIIGNPVVTSACASYEAIVRKPQFGRKVLTYLGSLSPSRNAKLLISGFGMACDAGLDGMLLFQGVSERDLQRNAGVNFRFRDRVCCETFTDDVEAVLARTDVLVNLDASGPGDVFVSGKLMTYLGTDLPIVSISTTDGPTSRMLTSLPEGCWVVPHEPKAIARAISEACQFTSWKKISKCRARFRLDNAPRVLAERLLG